MNVVEVLPTICLPEIILAFFSHAIYLRDEFGVVLPYVGPCSLFYKPVALSNLVVKACFVLFEPANLSVWRKSIPNVFRHAEMQRRNTIIFPLSHFLSASFQLASLMCEENLAGD